MQGHYSALKKTRVRTRTAEGRLLDGCGALEVTRGRLRVAEVRLQEYYGETEKARTIERRVEGRLQEHYSALRVAGALLCLRGECSARYHHAREGCRHPTLPRRRLKLWPTRGYGGTSGSWSLCGRGCEGPRRGCRRTTPLRGQFEQRREVSKGRTGRRGRRLVDASRRWNSAEA